MADFIHIKSKAGRDFLFNTDNIMSVEDNEDLREITLAERDNHENLAFDTEETMEAIIEKLRNPLVRPSPIVPTWKPTT